LADWNEQTHIYIHSKCLGIITLLNQLSMKNNSAASPSVLPGHIKKIDR